MRHPDPYLLAALALCLAPPASAGELIGEPVVSLGAASVDLQGNTALVGSFGGSHVYVREGGRWIHQGAFPHTNAAIDVALDGDTALIGTPSNDEHGADAGSVYVFTRSGTTWSLHQQLVASDGGAGDNFGIAVALEGDVAFFGAIGHGGAGAVYRFERVAGSWVEVEELVPDTPLSAGEGLGTALALEAGTLVAASYFGDA